MRRLPLIALALLAACGGGERGDVEKRVNALYAALGDGDAARVCASLTREQRRIAANGRSCEAVMAGGLRYLAPALRRSGRPKVDDVAIRGRSATATVELRGGRKSTIGLRKEGTRWLISELNLNRL